MSTLLADHLEWLRSRGRSAHTIHDRRHLLTRLDRDLPRGLDRATTDDLRAWLARGKWSAWTRRTYYSHIEGFYRWAVGGREPWAETDLGKPGNPDADPHPCTDEQVRLAMERSGPRWQVAIALAAYAGLRASEVTALRREHVTADDITVWHGKGDRSAALPCHPEIWARVGPLPPGLVMPSSAGKRIGNLSPRARRHFDEIGLPDLHMHMLRHWYCVSLLRSGNDIRTVQGLMRHRSLQTTAAYLPLVDAQRRTAIRTLRVPSSPQQSAA